MGNPLENGDPGAKRPVDHRREVRNPLGEGGSLTLENGQDPRDRPERDDPLDDETDTQRPTICLRMARDLKSSR